MDDENKMDEENKKMVGKTVRVLARSERGGLEQDLREVRFESTNAKAPVGRFVDAVVTAGSAAGLTARLAV